MPYFIFGQCYIYIYIYIYIYTMGTRKKVQNPEGVDVGFTKTNM